MLQRYLSFLLGFLLMGHLAVCQSFSTKVSAKTIGKKDVVQVEYVIENLELQDLILPVYTGWNILSGPNFSSNRLQTGNIVKQQVVYTLTLQPQATGRLNIPGAKATIENKTRLSNTVSIEVKDVEHLAGNQPQAQPNPQASILDQLAPLEDDVNDNQVLKKGENARDKINNNLFVKLDISKKTAYVGEPILATYKLCTRIRSQSRVLKQPSFEGCTVVEMTADEPLPQREKIGNKWYNVYIVRQVQLIPLQAGILELPKASVENKVTFYREGQVNYRDLFYNNPAVKPEESTVTFSNAPQQILVNALPQPAPAGFSGAVGAFALNISNSNEGVQSNTSNQLAISVEGSGNLQQARPAVINWPKGMEGFDPTEKEAVDKTVFPVGVVKTFTYPYVASKSGNYVIPPVQFIYFNIAQNKYLTLATQPLQLHIDKGSRKFLAVNPGTSSGDFYIRLYILLGLALLVIAGGIFWFSRSPKKAVTGTTPTVHPISLPVVEEKVDAEQYVFKIRELDPSVNSPLFYRQLHRNITAFLMSKYKILPAQIDQLSANNPSMAFALQKLASVLNSCSLGMYTPMYSTEDAVQHRLTALEALNNLENASLP